MITNNMITRYKDLFDPLWDLSTPSRYNSDFKILKDDESYKVYVSVPGLTKDDLKLSTLFTTFALDDLEKGGDIEIKELLPAGEAAGSSTQVTESIVRITKQGLEKL